MSINDNTAQRVKYENYDASAGDLGEYVVASTPSANSVTLTGATLEVNAFIDKVVKIVINGISEYCVIASNTADILVFDDTIKAGDVTGKTLQIMQTIAIKDVQLSGIYAFDIRLGNIAVLLPTSKVFNERRYIHVYIERFANGFSVPVVCRGIERQLGAKNGELVGAGEGVRLYPHQWLTPHWDVLQTFNIKRYGTGYWNANDDVVATSFTPITGALIGANITFDNFQRLVPIVKNGVSSLKYNSLFSRVMRVAVHTTIQKSGTTGEMTVALVKYTYATDTLAIVENRYAETLFAGGDGVASISFIAPVSMSFGDEIYVAAIKSGGTFSVLAKSSVDILEY